VDCDHIGWNSSEIISPLVNSGCSLNAHPNIRESSRRGTSGNFGPSDPPPVDLSVGDIQSQIVAEWLQIAQRSQRRAYRKPPSLFRMVQSLTPTITPCPQNWVPYTPRYANDHISAAGDRIHFMFCSRMGFSGTADPMALFWVRTNLRWRQRPSWKNFKWQYFCKRSSDPLHVWF